MARVQLLQHVQARTLLRLLPQQSIQLLSRRVQLLLDLPQPLLTLLHRAALRLHIQLLRLHMRGELRQPRLQPHALLFELNLLRGKLLQSHHVALLLQIQRVDLVAKTRQLLHRRERLALRRAQRLRLPRQLRLHLLQRLPLLLQRRAMLRQRGVARAETLDHPRQIQLRRARALLGFRDLRQRAGVLLFQFAQTLLVELDARIMLVGLRLQLHALLLARADLVLQLREPLAQMRDLILAAQHARRTLLQVAAQLLRARLTRHDLALQHVELMPRQLRVQVLQLQRQLLVTPRLARLPLQRSDLPLHLADEIRHAQEILIRVFQFAQRLLLVRFELRDARRLLEDHPAILRLAR